jgi:hypothetical protein
MVYTFCTIYLDYNRGGDLYFGGVEKVKHAEVVLAANHAITNPVIVDVAAIA